MMGINSGVVSVSVDASSLWSGYYEGTVTVFDSRATNNPQSVTIKLNVYGSTYPPSGNLDAPAENQECMGAFLVAGWALDDIEVQQVKIYRDPVGSEQGLIFVGDAVLVEGARPDVAAAFPDKPFSYRAGWGYMLLSYMLPGAGMDNWYTLYAYAYDKDGQSTVLGQKTIHCVNNQNNKPFGTIDTPTQGGTAYGSLFYNFGWVLTPQPDYIPYDGSKIWVWVDGVPLAHPSYNNYRADIATLFPGYANSNGAIGVYEMNTMSYPNGVHTIAWSAEDSGGQTEGLGSRYFSILNVTSPSPNSGIGSPTELKEKPLSYLDGVQADWKEIKVRTGYSVNAEKNRNGADDKGEHKIDMKEVDRLEIELAPDENKDDIENFEGYYQFVDKLIPLPVGSTFNASEGIFYWMPGPAFIGDYEFVFVKANKNKVKTQKKIKVKIGKDLPPLGDIILSARPDNLTTAEELGRKGPSACGETTLIATALSPAQIPPLAEPLIPTYYIYGYDGRLLAEYDSSGACVKDYIYFGGMLLAEYKPATSAYYYYTSDPINSVRLITDGTGSVVYSAAYGPYGAVEKEWVTTYNPELKYSGKEREKGAQADYFGARYYTNATFRWLSPDPVMDIQKAIENPQRWNRYAFCGNNPVTYWDPDGRKDININIIRFYESSTATIGMFYIPELKISGYTLERPWKENMDFVSSIPEGSYPAFIRTTRRIQLKDVKDRDAVQMHSGYTMEDTKGCILANTSVDFDNKTLLGDSRKLMESITTGMREEKNRDNNAKYRVNIINISIPGIMRYLDKKSENKK